MSHVGQPKRIDVRFSGNGQGVGFRYTTLAIARGFDVTGYVQNLRDSRVRLVAEGAPDELARFVAAIHNHMVDHITHTEANDDVAIGEFDVFQVRM